MFWTFHEAVRGLADACRAFGVPVISGNVSFYNESFGQPIYPTPTVGLVGLLDDVDQHCTAAFKDEGDVIVLVGETADELGGCEYLKVEHETVAGAPPALDLELERDVQQAVIAGIRGGLVKSAHDCSEGGIAVALAESCIAGGLGADVHLHDDLHPVASLFGETQSRIVVIGRRRGRREARRCARGCRGALQRHRHRGRRSPHDLRATERVARRDPRRVRTCAGTARTRR